MNVTQDAFQQFLMAEWHVSAEEAQSITQYIDFREKEDNGNVINLDDPNGFIAALLRARIGDQTQNFASRFAEWNSDSRSQAVAPVLATLNAQSQASEPQQPTLSNRDRSFLASVNIENGQNSVAELQNEKMLSTLGIAFSSASKLLTLSPAMTFANLLFLFIQGQLSGKPQGGIKALEDVFRKFGFSNVSYFEMSREGLARQLGNFFLTQILSQNQDSHTLNRDYKDLALAQSLNNLNGIEDPDLDLKIEILVKNILENKELVQKYESSQIAQKIEDQKAETLTKVRATQQWIHSEFNPAERAAELFIMAGQDPEKIKQAEEITGLKIGYIQAVISQCENEFDPRTMSRASFYHGSHPAMAGFSPEKSDYLVAVAQAYNNVILNESVDTIKMLAPSVFTIIALGMVSGGSLLAMPLIVGTVSTAGFGSMSYNTHQDVARQQSFHTAEIYTDATGLDEAEKMAKAQDEANAKKAVLITASSPFAFGVAGEMALGAATGGATVLADHTTNLNNGLASNSLDNLDEAIVLGALTAGVVKSGLGVAQKGLAAQKAVAPKAPDAPRVENTPQPSPTYKANKAAKATDSATNTRQPDEGIPNKSPSDFTKRPTRANDDPSSDAARELDTTDYSQIPSANDASPRPALPQENVLRVPLAKAAGNETATVQTLPNVTNKDASLTARNMAGDSSDNGSGSGNGQTSPGTGESQSSVLDQTQRAQPAATQPRREDLGATQVSQSRRFEAGDIVEYKGERFVVARVDNVDGEEILMRALSDQREVTVAPRHLKQLTHNISPNTAQKSAAAKPQSTKHNFVADQEVTFEGETWKIGVLYDDGTAYLYRRLPDSTFVEKTDVAINSLQPAPTRSRRGSPDGERRLRERSPFGDMRRPPRAKPTGDDTEAYDVNLLARQADDATPARAEPSQPKSETDEGWVVSDDTPVATQTGRDTFEHDFGGTSSGKSGKPTAKPADADPIPALSALAKTGDTVSYKGHTWQVIDVDTTRGYVVLSRPSHKPGVPITENVPLNTLKGTGSTRSSSSTNSPTRRTSTPQETNIRALLSQPKGRKHILETLVDDKNPTLTNRVLLNLQDIARQADGAQRQEAETLLRDFLLTNNGVETYVRALCKLPDEGFDEALDYLQRDLIGNGIDRQIPELIERANAALQTNGRGYLPPLRPKADDFDDLTPAALVEGTGTNRGVRHDADGLPESPIFPSELEDSGSMATASNGSTSTPTSQPRTSHRGQTSERNHPTRPQRTHEARPKTRSRSDKQSSGQDSQRGVLPETSWSGDRLDPNQFECIPATDSRFANLKNGPFGWQMQTVALLGKDGVRRAYQTGPLVTQDGQMYLTIRMGQLNRHGVLPANALVTKQNRFTQGPENVYVRIEDADVVVAKR